MQDPDNTEAPAAECIINVGASAARIMNDEAIVSLGMFLSRAGSYLSEQRALTYTMATMWLALWTPDQYTPTQHGAEPTCRPALSHKTYTLTSHISRDRQFSSFV